MCRLFPPSGSFLPRDKLGICDGRGRKRCDLTGKPSEVGELMASPLGGFAVIQISPLKCVRHAGPDPR